MRRLALVLLPFALSACDGCNGSTAPRVPFGVDTGSHGDGDETGRREETPAEPAFEPTIGQSFAEGTRRVAIQGAPIALDAGEVRAVLPVDLDADGDRDAIVVSASDGSAELLHARRDGATFAGPRPLGRMPAPVEGCTVGDVAMRTISTGYAVATLSRACPGGTSQSVWIVSLEAQPRLRESVTLLPEEGRAPGEVRIAIRTRDSDGDGHTDVLLDVSVTPAVLPGDAAQAPPAAASIAWLDRPGGLARDTAEPEAAIAALAQRARDARERDPAAALAAARQALALHAALCREAGAPRVRFGDADGIACRASEGAGRAAAMATFALARRGEVFAALAARARLDEPAFRVSAADRRLADEALTALATTEGVRTNEGPAALAGAAPDVHLPLVGFRDERTLVVRGAAPAVYRIGDDGIAPSDPPATVEGDLVLTDPSGRWAVVDVRRTCEGHVLVIVRAAEVVSGVVAGRAVSEPLLEPRTPPPGSACPRTLAAGARDDDGGWRIAGWAPQGVVAIRRDEVRLVPLTVDARPAGDPVALDPGTPVPAPLPPGRMSPDGSAYALVTPIGIVVRHDSRARAFRPASWTPEVTDVAVSPSGRRVAFVAGGRVQVAMLPE
jgi:hypothetical protein